MAEIRVQQLHKAFADFTAVKDSTFTVRNGEFFCVPIPIRPAAVSRILSVLAVLKTIALLAELCPICKPVSLSSKVAA